MRLWENGRIPAGDVSRYGDEIGRSTLDGDDNGSERIYTEG